MQRYPAVFSEFVFIGKGLRLSFADSSPTASLWKLPEVSLPLVCISATVVQGVSAFAFSAAGPQCWFPEMLGRLLALPSGGTKVKFRRVIYCCRLEGNHGVSRS